jgi:hypothetical protein
MALSKIDVANMLTGEVPNANVATIGVAKGGTGLTSGTSGQFLKFTGSTTLASTALSAGKVLQVVNAVQSSEYTRTATSFGASSTGVTITPSATSSKVLVEIHCGVIEIGNDSTQGIDMKLTRSIGASDTDLISQIHNDAGVFTNQSGSVYRTFTGHASVSYLDSPNTTSACQYRIYIKCKNTNTYVGVQMHSSSSTFTAMEIDGS